MHYQIKIVDINHPGIDLALRELIKAANNSSDLLPEKFLAKNLSSNASRPSFFLVAEENDEMIGCNAFLANDFLLNGVSYTGYQSCWSATHPDHQGKKVFTSIINEAKKILKEKGAGFLYGIANDRSNPIFTKKLGFSETGSIVLRIPNIPFFRQAYFDNDAVLGNDNACVIDEQQVKEHKMQQSPSDVKVIHFNNSWLWGKLQYRKKLGIKLPVFYVGGVYLAAGKDLNGLVSGIFSSHKVLFAQFFSCETNTFNVLLKGWRKSRMNGFIFYNLNMPAFTNLNLMIGVLDIF
ncbi:MAG: GNAT family N-acetyltransferase [Chitinophagaceae bacterium]|nr:GNAT family N-acetyltransferase [Chitinophagaceae bacterium]